MTTPTGTAAEPLLRVFFGVGSLDLMCEEYARRIATCEKWSTLSRLAEGDEMRTGDSTPARDTASASTTAAS